MRNSGLVRYALVVCASGAILAGCNSGSQSSVPGPTGFNQAQTVPTGSAIAGGTGGGQPQYNSLRRLSVTERLIHSFGAAGSGDGYFPLATLLDVNGAFYGTTVYSPGHNAYDGTVFKATPSGKETVLHTFTGTDGANPSAKLIDVKGTLYGTTSEGGANGYGTVFSITQSGRRTTVYTFAGGSDGSFPSSALTNVNGTLYGTTNQGGTYGDGTVYSVTTTGHETVLHSFGAGSDGAHLLAGLINVNGTLYGTTVNGGASSEGTVFSLTTSGSEKVLHSFSGPPDGEAPEAGLTNVNGTIYGTTFGGGLKMNDCTGTPTGCGTVFSIDSSGNYKVIYSFAALPDAQLPEANLLNANGTLYGTTSAGGTSNDGTVFTITTSGQETVLYSFKGRVKGHFDGQLPVSGLIDIKGVLFGTTKYGGAYTQECRTTLGCGTVFSISP